MIELTDYQKLAIEKLRTGSILVGGVGSGKSLTSLGYFFEKVYKKNGIEKLYIITTAQKRDKNEWFEEIINYLRDRTIIFDLDSLKIDSWNNIKKYQEVTHSFFIFDEQRLVGYGAWTKSFLKIVKSNDWILLSATPGDQWSDYISVFVANGFYKNKSDFCRKHIVYKPFMNYPVIDHYVYEDILKKYREKISVYMDAERHTTRKIFNIKCLYEKDIYMKGIKERYDQFNDISLDTAPALAQYLRRVVNTHWSKYCNLVTVLRMNSRAIIFYNYNYELEKLKDQLEFMSIRYSEWNGSKHEQIPPGDEWVYLVQYNAGCEGWNCTLTDTIIFFSLNYSYRVMEQAAGRIDRMNTPYTLLKYYYFYTPGTIDDAIRRCIEKKKIFNEKRYFDDSRKFHSI